MAEKLFTNVRLGLKVDTLENWSKSTLPLKRGEVAFATVAATAGNGLTEPVVMMKIGEDGVKTFKDIEWNFYAKASDVLAACKTEKGLTDFINSVITDAKLASAADLTALAGRVSTAEGEIDTLQSEMDAVEAKAAANETAIGNLQTLVGGDGKNVATQITDAISALKLGETYAAKSLEKTVSDHVADTVSHVTTSDKTTWNAALQTSDIATGSVNGTIAVKGNDVAVKGLGSAAFTESTAYDAAGSANTAESNAKAYAKEYADGLAGNYDTKGAAAAAQSAAETYAKNYADGLAGNYDAAGSAAAAEKNAKDYTDAQFTAKVGDKTVGVQISDAITGLNLPNTYAAKEHKHVKADITDFAHTHEIADVNGLQGALDGKQAVGDYATKTEAQGYADAKDEAIAAAKKAGDDAQKEVDALETYVGSIPETANATSIVGYIQEKTAGIASEGAMTELAGRVTAAEGKIEDLQTDISDATVGLKGRMSVAEESINTLNTLVGTESVATQISTAVKEEADRAKLAEKANADAIALLNNNAETAGSVDYKIAQAVAAIMENPDETMNSINELVTWTNEHAEDALEMSNQVTANKNAIATLNGGADVAGSVDKKIADAIAAENLSQYATDTELTGVDNRLKAVETAVGETGSVATAIENAVTAANGYTDTEIAKLTAEGGSVKVNADKIAALEAKVGDKTVSEQIADVTNPLDERIDALEAIDHEHANKAELDKFVDGDKAKLDAAVQTVTAGTGLKAVKTGTDVAIDLDETVIFIFDCGTSAE